MVRRDDPAPAPAAVAAAPPAVSAAPRPAEEASFSEEGEEEAGATTTLRGLPRKSLEAASETEECSPPSGAIEPSGDEQFLSVPHPWPAVKQGAPAAAVPERRR